MTIDYDKIVEDFDISKLTKKKITASFVRKNFKDAISDLRTVVTDEPELLGDSQIMDENLVPISSIFMGQEMPTRIWLSFVSNMMTGEFVKTVKTHKGVFFVTYNKTKTNTKSELISLEISDIPEKTIVSEIKKAIIRKF